VGSRAQRAIVHLDRIGERYGCGTVWGQMGRQVRFFNFPADVAAFETYAAENRATIICGTAPTADPVVAPTLRAGLDDPSFFDLLLVRHGDLPHLRWPYLAARQTWAVDKDASPVVEYTPGYRRDGQPAFLAANAMPGRLWFQTSHWEGAQLVDADPEFTAWASRLFRWVKNHWVLIDGDYFSPGAAKLWTAMWHVVLDEPCEGTGADQISRWRRTRGRTSRRSGGGGRAGPRVCHGFAQPRSVTARLRPGTAALASFPTVDQGEAEHRGPTAGHISGRAAAGVDSGRPPAANSGSSWIRRMAPFGSVDGTCRLGHVTKIAANRRTIGPR
jgi:hypothetical protein